MKMPSLSAKMPVLQGLKYHIIVCVVFSIIYTLFNPPIFPALLGVFLFSLTPIFFIVFVFPFVEFGIVSFIIYLSSTVLLLKKRNILCFIIFEICHFFTFVLLNNGEWIGP